MSDDPRWGDGPRGREAGSGDLSRGGRAGSDARERDQVDPRDLFMEHVDLPRGLEREHVHAHDHDYTLRGSKPAPCGSRTVTECSQTPDPVRWTMRCSRAQAASRPSNSVTGTVISLLWSTSPETGIPVGPVSTRPCAVT
jgi:hypothetical protein